MKRLLSIVFLFCACTSGLYAQVKVGSNPTSISATSNLEVEASNGNKTIVNKATGQVTIQDGTQGAGKVLTSDANGGSSWAALSSLNVPEIIFLATQNNTAANPYVVPANVASNSLASRIPFTPTLGGANWNSTTKQYTIPSAGFYRVSGGLRCQGSVLMTIQLVLLAGIIPSDAFSVSPTVSYARTFTIATQYNGGETVSFNVDNTFGSNATASCFTGYLMVEKLK